MRWDIFCKVIDNLGDLGVCWRLARQLVMEHGLSVRLWVNSPVQSHECQKIVSSASMPYETFASPCTPSPLVGEGEAAVQYETTLAHAEPSPSPTRGEGTSAPDGTTDVQVCRWVEPFVFDSVADVVIEAFGCELPENYVRAMAAQPLPPVWINLEYLGLEEWVSGCHGLASPHPRLPLVKHFFFPGFTAQTGGLLRERDLFGRQAGFRSHVLPMLNDDGRLLAAPTIEHEFDDTLLVSLFCYDTAPFASLLAAWVAVGKPLVCLVPQGKPLAVVRACLQGDAPWTIGKVRIVPIPFLAQDAYDELLFACDLNFVRGEDSFVRAQWAGKPFVWQIYPQDAGVHLQKLGAFLDLYRPLPCLARFWQAWNGDGNADFKQAWSLLRQALPQVAQHNIVWRKKLAAQKDLASALVNFCAAQV